MVCGRGLYETWGPEFQKILPSLRTLTYEAKRTLNLPRRARAQAAKELPLVVSSIGIGAKSVPRGSLRGGVQCSQRRSQGGEQGSGRCRFSGGGQGEAALIPTVFIKLPSVSINTLPPQYGYTTLQQIPRSPPLSV